MKDLRTTEEINQRFGHLFKLNYGFECSVGWNNILYSLFAVIDKIAPEDFKIVQVKEKFGTLRVYTSNSTDTIDELITLAEFMTEMTCEQTGGPGHRQALGSWIKTASDSAIAEMKMRRALQDADIKVQSFNDAMVTGLKDPEFVTQLKKLLLKPKLETS